MSEKNALSCAACGARLSADAEACDLCGTPVDAAGLPQREEAADRARTRSDAADEAPEAPSSRAVYCNACGWENPAGARFCSQCGEALQDLEAPSARPVAADLPRAAATEAAAEDDEPEASADEASSGVTRQVGIIIGAAVLLVVGLFVASTWSQQMDWGTASDAPEPTAAAPGTEAAPGVEGAPGAGGAMPPSAQEPADLEALVEEHAADAVPDRLRDEVAALEEEIAAREGEAQRAHRQELVNLYVGAGAMGPAALVQRQMAEASGTPEDWRRAGDLLYSWMESLRGQEPSFDVAEHVVRAYQRVLDEDPGNLDVRTDMATAYLQTRSPMRGVEEINRVLDEDPDHFQARFNKGIMLTMIGRADEAIAEFERVKEIVGTDSPYYRQAEQAIEAIQERLREAEGAS